MGNETKNVSHYPPRRILSFSWTAIFWRIVAYMPSSTYCAIRFSFRDNVHTIRYHDLLATLRVRPNSALRRRRRLEVTNVKGGSLRAPPKPTPKMSLLSVVYCAFRPRRRSKKSQARRKAKLVGANESEADCTWKIGNAATTDLFCKKEGEMKKKKREAKRFSCLPKVLRLFPYK